MFNHSLLDVPEQYEHTPYQHTLTDYAQIGVHSFLVLLGVPINVVAFWRTWISWRQCVKHRRFEGAHFLLLKLHLVVADVLVLIYAAAYAAWLGSVQWLGPAWLCKATSFLFAFALYSASNVVACIAIARTTTVCNVASSISRQAVYKRTLWMLCAAWFLATVCGCPQWYVWVVVLATPTWRQCATIWAVHRHEDGLSDDVQFTDEKLYEFFHLLVVFWIPALVMLTCHALITCRLRKNSRLSCPSQSYADSQSCTPRSSSRKLTSCTILSYSAEPQTVHLLNRSQLRRSMKWKHAQRRTTGQFFAIVLVYFICFLPYSCLSLWSHVHPESFVHLSGDNYEFLKGLIVLEAVLNPLLYKFGSCFR